MYDRGTIEYNCSTIVGPKSPGGGSVLRSHYDRTTIEYDRVRIGYDRTTIVVRVFSNFADPSMGDCMSHPVRTPIVPRSYSIVPQSYSIVPRSYAGCSPVVPRLYSIVPDRTPIVPRSSVRQHATDARMYDRSTIVPWSYLIVLDRAPIVPRSYPIVPRS